MSASPTRVVVTRAMLLATLALALGGCTYDYLQRTDRIAYSAGDAVRANLERETLDPSKASMKKTKGLGANGVVKPAETASAEEVPIVETE